MRKARVREITITRTVKQIEKQCATCGKSFWGTKKSRYCSRECRNRAYYEHHGETLRQKRVEKYRKEKQAVAGKK